MTYFVGVGLSIVRILFCPFSEFWSVHCSYFGLSILRILVEQNPRCAHHLLFIFRGSHDDDFSALGAIGTELYRRRACRGVVGEALR